MNNQTLTKIGAVKAVSATTKQSQAVVETVVEAFLKQIESTLSSGRRVEFRGFGIWEVRMSKERVGRNPKRPEAGDVRIPSRPGIRFKVGKELKSAIQNNFKRFFSSPDPTPVAPAVVASVVQAAPTA
jgi:nucleoid DNA-binding protein